MKSYFIFLGIFFFVCFAYCQESDPSFYLFGDTLQNLDINPSSKAIRYSVIGEYQKALLTYDIHPSVRQESHYVHDLDSFFISRAKEYLIAQAQSNNIIIINEGHNRPRHRVFIKGLLAQLFEKGFRYLALEALANCTECYRNYNKEGCCSNNYESKYLYLTSEPQMSNLIRHGQDLGYILVPYEQEKKGNRELIQAQNIYNRIFKIDQNAKVVVVCGYCHVLESEGEKTKNCGKTKWMAGYLKDITGIDPLTIDQEVLSERTKYDENPNYEALSQIQFSAVLVNKVTGISDIDGNPFKVDISVYHPRSSQINGRPSWLSAQENAKIYQLEEGYCDDIGYPCLVEAWRKCDKSDAVPYDIVELERGENSSLVLTIGEFQIRATSNLGISKSTQIKFE